MAAVDDAATVLEQFCHDVANLPAEIQHLLEEIQAKDREIVECRNVIESRDNALQKWIRQNGSHVKNPKEEGYSKTILGNFDRAEILQSEKLGLAEKAMIILDRQIKRFDIKLRDLQATDQLPLDPTLPSLLQPSAANTVPITSGVSTPLASLSVNSAQGGGAPNIANAAMARMNAAQSSRTHSPSAAQNPMLTQAHLAGSAQRPQRESSADASKRRRLNASINLPTTSSSLRQSSIGPGTPKPGTPLPQTSRAGSAQPTRPAATKKTVINNKKVAPHQASAAAAARKRVRTSTNTLQSSKKGDRRSQLARDRKGRGGSPSTSPTPSDSQASTSPTPSSLPHGHDGTSEGRSRRRGADASDDEGEEVEADAENEDDDSQVYCTCQRVSFGDMVACDNDECPYQWFHWGCVGLKEEPKGEWLCPSCRELPKDKIVKA